MRYLSLFSGIEACSVAWKPLGWECVGVAEVEPFTCAVLAHHYPGVPNLGDVTQITDERIAAGDAVDRQADPTRRRFQGSAVSHYVRLMREGWDAPVVVKIPESVEPHVLLELCRREVFPGVEVVREPIAVPQPKKKRSRT